MRNVALSIVLGVFLLIAPSDRSGISIRMGCDCGEEVVTQETSTKTPLFDQLEGNGVRAHDPALAKEGNHYYMFCTGPGISIRSSTDRQKWSMPYKVFEKPVEWSATAIPGSKDTYWAPDISYFDHKWHLYYSVSTFGKNRSAIGLATNVTLDPHRPDYKWVDEGSVVESHLTDNYNAIDPNIVLDKQGEPWLAFGSFWSGLKIVPLNRNGGKPISGGSAPTAIASRERPGAIEAPFIVHHGRYFYLFASFDFCCRGIKSTYNIRVGRSVSVAGPYLDKGGHSMLEGGGTVLLASAGRWHGPGGNSVLHDGGKDYLVYHAYDGEDNGIPKLRIEPLHWDKDGWPEVASRY